MDALPIPENHSHPYANFFLSFFLAFYLNAFFGFLLTSLSIYWLNRKQQCITPSQQPLTPSRCSGWYLSSYFFGVIGWIIALWIEYHAVISEIKNKENSDRSMVSFSNGP